ncbi:GNAT family N-acetyltransferase [Rhodococcus sp. X156]|uniref:GNAT family N-acetyltransferase n=1 Tax=Rhodococcus sp. X156 TaxID=2499145 RepID=UPI000FDAA585|nr:GNAT family N-acetyltransferase [Rhodococcus sp. X156]
MTEPTTAGTQATHGELGAPLVTNNPDESRFELRVDGNLVGLADYRVHAGRMVFTHTEVDPGLGGRGLGGVLIGAALAEVRNQGLSADPQCSFVDDYLNRHPEHADLRHRR